MHIQHSTFNIQHSFQHSFNLVFDARCIADHFPGIGRYSYNLVRALARLEQELRIVLLYHPGQLNTRYDLGLLAAQGVKLIPVDAAPFSPTTQLLIPRILRQLKADVYHSPYYVRPYLQLPCPSVTTLYDLIPHHFPNFVSRRAALLFDSLHRLAIRSSDALITLSEHAVSEFASAYHIPSTKLHVTPPAIDPEFVPQPTSSIDVLRKRLRLPLHYVLSLSSNKPHKNVETLLRAWAALECRGQRRSSLVIAGHQDAHYPQAQQIARRLGLNSQLIFLPNVTAADLPGLYAGAELFVFASLYEGFGLPPLEAMACGTPVICGDHSSLPEVVGQAAVRVDVSNVHELSEAIGQLLADPRRRDAMAAEGLKQASQFSWERCASATVAIYRRAI